MYYLPVINYSKIGVVFFFFKKKGTQDSDK